MSHIITVKIVSDDSNLTGKAVSNAVRRAFGTSTDTLPEAGEVKGVRFSVKQKKTPSRPSANSEIASIRAWARAAGVPVGERGRIKAEVKAAYAEANLK